MSDAVAVCVEKIAWLLKRIACSFLLPLPQKIMVLDDNNSEKLLSWRIIAQGFLITANDLSYIAVKTSIRRASTSGQIRPAPSSFTA